MTPMLFLLGVGVLLLVAGIKGQTIGEFLRGDPGTRQNASTGFARVFDVDAFRQRAVVTIPEGSAGTQSASDIAPTAGTVMGLTPKDIIEKSVLPLARQHGINVSPQSVAAANARHGPTIGGGRSDHQGPPDRAWAADMSNGTSPTPQMDALAKDVCALFNIPWHGSGAVSRVVTVEGKRYRVQVIYRSNVGGNHYNHVHCGLRTA